MFWAIEVLYNVHARLTRKNKEHNTPCLSFYCGMKKISVEIQAWPNDNDKSLRKLLKGLQQVSQSTFGRTKCITTTSVITGCVVNWDWLRQWEMTIFDPPTESDFWNLYIFQICKCLRPNSITLSNLRTSSWARELVADLRASWIAPDRANSITLSRSLTAR